ncbi:DUF397 domain-containing protein [Streptomyces aidingensis]|uniref:DUF397 domain-containing protein n=1 Tax=Streptomyces aidingensis TaxID=910347 RepID=A0A1I1JGK4_9ACTN|nr:DUF397 domain-containing protein [Streptomyces aidingensis]SFC44570.1 protein of unknown function [Streptomyces aidingensis]
MTTEVPRWFKSSHSNNGGACVEVAEDFAASRGVVPVRDSKNLDGPVLNVPTAAFSSLVAGIKARRVGTA